MPDTLVLYDFLKEVVNLDDFSLNVLPTEDGLGVIALKDTDGKLLMGDGPDSDGTAVDDSDAPPHAPFTAPAAQSAALPAPPAHAAPPAASPAPADPSSVENLFSKLIFPLSFPSLQCEHIEDISLNVILLASLNGKKFSVPGVLILTNYRLLYVTHARIFQCADLEDELAFPQVDLSTQVYIGQVVTVHLSSEHDINSNVYYETIKVRTTDHRNLVFMFKDDAFNLNENWYVKKLTKRISGLLGGTGRKRSESSALTARLASVSTDDLSPAPMLDQIYENSSQRKMSIFNYTNSLAPHPTVSSSNLSSLSSLVGPTSSMNTVLGFNLGKPPLPCASVLCFGPPVCAPCLSPPSLLALF